MSEEWSDEVLAIACAEQLKTLKEEISELPIACARLQLEPTLENGFILGVEFVTMNILLKAMNILLAPRSESENPGAIPQLAEQYHRSCHQLIAGTYQCKGADLVHKILESNLERPVVTKDDIVNSIKEHLTKLGIKANTVAVHPSSSDPSKAN